MTDAKPDTKPSERLQELIKQLARQHQYPPTPDVAGQVMQRMGQQRGRFARLPMSAWIATALVALLMVVVAVPPVRAAVVEAIRVGAVRLLSGESGQGQVATPIPLLRGLAGETSLETARESVDFEIPTPADWPDPDYVFVQELEDVPAVILVWVDEDDPGEINLSLHLIGASQIPLIDKLNLQYLEETQVNGEPAVWIEGPHIYQQTSGGTTFERLVEGNVLLWTVGDITYRLETTFSQAEALAIAESLE
jgi:hypothetical protein